MKPSLGDLLIEQLELKLTPSMKIKWLSQNRESLDSIYITLIDCDSNIINITPVVSSSKHTHEHMNVLAIALDIFIDKVEAYESQAFRSVEYTDHYDLACEVYTGSTYYMHINKL